MNNLFYRRSATAVVIALIGLMVALSVTTSQAAINRAQRVRVNIRASHAYVDHREIRLEDVADLSGGNPRTRKEMARLDLDSITGTSSVKILRTQIAVRLLVAGFVREQFEITGPVSTQVRFGSAVNLQRTIEDSIATDLGQQFGLDVADVQVTLLDKNVVTQIRDSIDTMSFQAMSIFPTKIPLGEKTFTVEFSDATGGRISVRVPLRIVVMRKVVVSSSPLPRGTVIATHHVQSVKRPLIDNSIELASLDCVGCKVTRDIGPHEIVSTRYLSKHDPADAILVKRNDIVDILLVRGPLTIRLKNAKVITPGGKGAVVQVLNPASGKPITAVVASKSIVEVRR